MILRALASMSNPSSIRERPAAVEDRAVPGHWEGDLLAGKNNSHIVTLVERHSRYVMLAKVSSKETATVVTVLARTAPHTSRAPSNAAFVRDFPSCRCR